MRNLKQIVVLIFMLSILFMQDKLSAQIQKLPGSQQDNVITIGGIPQPKLARAIGTDEMALPSNAKLAAHFNSASALCPPPAFDFSPSKSVNCNATCVNLDVRDSAFTTGALGEWMEHAALIVFQTDGFNDAQNTMEIWTNGGTYLLLRIGPSNTGVGTPQSYFTWPGWFGSSMNSKTARIWLYNICPGEGVVYKWFDSGNNAAQPWYVWDPATNTVVASGTFSGGSNSIGPYSNWGGTSTWTCATCPPGSFGQICNGSFARFCPSAAKPGKYGITYKWDNTLTGVDACVATFTDTIEVLPIYKTTWNPPASICETSSSVSLTSYLDGLSTPGGTWSGSGVTGSNWSTTGLSGNITLTYTVGAGTSCESKESHTITVNPKPTVSVAPVTPICSSGSTNVTLTATGNATTYTWAPGGATGTTTSVSPSITTVYTVTATSASSCTRTATVTVTINPAVTVSSTSADVKCNGDASGYINITPGAGTPGYTFSWSNNKTTQNISGLSGGGYTVTITDSQGCTITTAATINEPATKVEAKNPAGTPTGCGASSATGTVSVTGSGGTGTLTYLWNPGSYTGSTVNNLGANTYTVTVTDANGCTATTSATVAPPAGGPVITATPINSPTCNGGTDGSAYTNATGGSGTYDILWTPGGGTGKNIINVGAGNYTVTYTDKVSQCVSSKTVVITEPPAFSMNQSVTDINCKGQTTGAITLNNPTGNTPPLTYKWLPGNITTKDLTNIGPGTYSLTVTDLNGCSATFSYTVNEPSSALTVSAPTTTQSGCGVSTGSASVTSSGGTPNYTYSWSNSITTPTNNNIGAGSYVVTVTDSKGCTVTTVAVVSTAGGPTITVANSTNPLCSGGTGSATVTATGGTGTLTYSWSSPGGTSTTLNNLPAGTYTVTVTDNSSCSVVSTVAVVAPPAVSAVPTSTPASCGLTNGSVTATGTGGTGTLTYSWSAPGSTTNSMNNLAAGSYTVTITDANNCTSTTVATVSNSGGPTANYNPSATIGETPLKVDFTDASTGGPTQWYWSFGDGSPIDSAQNPSHTYTKDGTFNACLVAKTAAGCLDSICKTITVSGYDIRVPNVFTPNDDTKNDLVRIFTKGVSKVDVTIYDRWGLKMAEITGAVPDVNGYVTAWDGKNASGKDAPDGTYYYIAKAYGFDTKTHEYTGFLTLIR